MNEDTVSRAQNDVIWIQKNRDFLWANYAGKWIAVQGEQLVAVGGSVRDGKDQAKAKGFEHPVVTAVRAKEYQGVILIRRS